MDSMMQQPIPHGRFVDFARLWIVNAEIGISTVTVRAVHQIQMQIRDLVPEMEHELLHIFLLSFPSDKLLPSFTLIFHRCNFIEGDE